MLILNALTHLITLLLYTGHQCVHFMVLLCVQYNVKLCCPFFESNDSEGWCPRHLEHTIIISLIKLTAGGEIEAV